MYSARYEWIHGSDIGIDEEGELWVRAEARLSVVAQRVQPLGHQHGVTPSNFREYSILTSGAKTGLNPRDRSEPVWKHVHSLDARSVGQEWIAVDRRNTERGKNDAAVREEPVR